MDQEFKIDVYPQEFERLWAWAFKVIVYLKNQEETEECLRQIAKAEEFSRDCRVCIGRIITALAKYGDQANMPRELRLELTNIIIMAWSKGEILKDDLKVTYKDFDKENS